MEKEQPHSDQLEKEKAEVLQKINVNECKKKIY